MSGMMFFPAHLNEKGALAETIGEVYYNKCQSKRLSYCRYFTRCVYVTKTGHYWMHIELDGLGDYIAPLSKDQAEQVIQLNKEVNARPRVSGMRWCV